MKKRTGVFSQIYIHVIFAVQGRASMISSNWEEELYKYITGIVTNKNQKMLQINSAFDHIHFLIGMKPSCCLSDLVREIKKSSNDFVNQKQFTKSKFYWQEGYGSFSHSHRELDGVIKYIATQKEHHEKTSFKSEYIELLKEFEVDYDEAYLFDWLD